MRLLLLALTVPALAADLPPDKGNEIPASGKRPVVVTGKSSLALPMFDLPEGYTLSVAAAAPLVTHPIMGCLDDKGRLFVGDGVGVNWNKKQLEENPPNRVLMLEDTDKDGSFDKSTIFADKMTFPQGACWLNGSLYVCSPPGLWKLTDTDNDGVADQREMIVSGFEYTGNAADVHGPFLHPNGRLYWCHGRKGHKVVQKDGTPVDASLACGIWSCRPDGSDEGAVLLLHVVAFAAVAPVKASVGMQKRAMDVGGVAGVFETADDHLALVGDAIVVGIGEFPDAGR